MPKSCCAVGCQNHNMMKEKKVSFHTFPKDQERRQMWINALKRVNQDGTTWLPGKETVVCGEHFILGKPNSDPNHPDFVPTVFTYNPTSTKQSQNKLKRYASAVKRKITFSSATHTPAKRRVLKPISVENDININGEVFNSPPLDSIPETPKTGLSAPVGDTEREMLYKELENLRNERDRLLEENSKLKCENEAVRLGHKCIENNDTKSKFYTGVPWDIFLTLSTFLTRFLKSSTTSKISLMDQFFLTLVKLRLDLPFEFISYHTGISKATVSDFFWLWIELMHVKLDYLIKWPDREEIQRTLPGVFKLNFPRLTCIVDCFEIFIDRPRDLKARAKCYSNYKKHSTVKVFIGCTPLGSVSFLSVAWGGRVSDIEIVRNSGFISNKFHIPGDQILADRGFTLQDDFATICSAELIIPSFTKGKKQLSAQENEISRKISSVRIHIERVIGLIKNRFAILQGTLSINVVKSLTDEADDAELARIDKLVRVCAILVNLGEGIVYSES